MATKKTCTICEKSMVKLRRHLLDLQVLIIDEVNDMTYEHKEKETGSDYFSCPYAECKKRTSKDGYVDYKK